MSPWIQYTLLRLGIFAAAFALLSVVMPAPLASVGIVGFATIVIAAVVAAIIALTMSYIFLGGLRDAVALDLAARREQPAVDPDAEAEDAVSAAAVADDDSPAHP